MLTDRKGSGERRHHSLRGVVHPQADLAYHDVARVQTDPCLEVDPVIASQLLRVNAQLIATGSTRFALAMIPLDHRADDGLVSVPSTTTGVLVPRHHV